MKLIHLINLLIMPIGLLRLIQKINILWLNTEENRVYMKYILQAMMMGCLFIELIRVAVVMLMVLCKLHHSTHAVAG